jgi:hypothetical protein
MNQLYAPPQPAPPRWYHRPLRRLLRRWRERHRHPFNFCIHLIGIPLAVTGVVLMWNGVWGWGLAAFVVGYALQYVGHRVEGNDVGEWAAVKRLLGLPYVAVAPRPRDEHLYQGKRFTPTDMGKV